MKTKYLLIEVAFMITLTSLLPAFSLAQGTWTQKADFAGGTRYGATGFSIGTKAYIGFGFDYLDNGTRDFWEWDKATNVWTRKADLPGNLTFYAVSFSIGTKGYLLSGTGYNGITYAQDFWEYDPLVDKWTQRASVPTNTPARESAVGFSIGTKGYIGIGNIIDSLPGSYNQDFWEYDQATNTWTKKADFMGVARLGAVGFSIGNKGYIGTGWSGYTLNKEFWEWDQASNVWTKKANFGGTSRWRAVGFSIGNKGYIGTGTDNINIVLNDFWEWDQINDIWTKKTDFGGIARSYPVGFSIGNKGYIGTGIDSSAIYATQDFWEYDPLETTGIAMLAKGNSSIYPNPASDIINFNFNTQNNEDVTLNIYNVTGKLVKSELLEPSQHQINVADLRNGIYMVDIRNNNWSKNQKLIIQR